MWSAPGSPRTARPAPARSRNVLNDPRDVQHLDVHALAVVVGERYSSWSYSQPLGASLRRVTTSAQADVVALGGCPGSTTPPSSRRPPTPSPSSTPNAAGYPSSSSTKRTCWPTTSSKASACSP